MKAKFLFTILLAAIIYSCTPTKKSDFLFLNTAQLKKVGIVVTDQGVFYKNVNPNWKQDKERYAFLGFYLCNDNYLSSIHLNETDTLEIKSKNDSLLEITETSHNDFYPVLIGNTTGFQSMDKDLPKDMKLLPIAVCMSGANLPNRSDTVVVWFKPTQSLYAMLPENINMEEYLRTKPEAKINLSLN